VTPVFDFHVGIFKLAAMVDKSAWEPQIP
jgi:hypothetical protein